MRNRIHAALAALMLAITGATAQSFVHQQSEGYRWPDDPKVVEKLKQWQDLKFGIILHWGLYSVPGIVESWAITSEDWITPPADKTYEEFKQWYWGLSADFNPTLFDPGQWARVSREAGMKYVVFTTKHHDGFAMFDTKTTDFKVTNSGFKDDERSDVLRYVMDAYRAEGLMPGLYFSKPDWHSNDYWWTAKATPTRHHNYNIEQYPERWESYKRYVAAQVDELMTNYGDIDILWLDGGWCTPPREDIALGDIVASARQKQPGLIVVERSCPGEFENYQTPEQKIPDHQILNPWESCITLTNDWGWVPEPQFKSPARVIALLSEIVAKGGSLLLGVGPTAQGLIEDESVWRLKQIGAWLDKNGEAIYATTTPPPYTNDDHSVWYTATKDGKTLYAIIANKDDNGVPTTVSWTGNTPVKGTKMTNLATGKTVKYTTTDSTTTVHLPAGSASTDGVALRFSISH